MTLPTNRTTANTPAEHLSDHSVLHATYNLIGQPNGVATLDATGLIPVGQLPSAAALDAEVTAAVANLVNSAPSTLNTLGELAAALGSDPNFATTMTNALALKAADNTVVHLAGAEVITGVKTFNTGGITLTDVNVALGTTTGTKIGTATSQKLGFFNATPIAQPANTTDLKTVMVNLGLVAGAGATPLNLGGGAATLGATTVTTLGTGGTVTLADTNNIVVGTTTGTQIGTATTQKLGFFGAAPVVQQAGATDVLASLVSLGFRAASANPPLNMGTGTLTCGAIGSATITITDANNIVVGTTTGTKIGTATTQKLGFFNATPVVQPGSTTDLKIALVNLGLLASGAATPLNLNAGALTAGATLVSTLGTAGDVTMTDGNNIIVGTTTGTRIGTATTQKIGFYGTAPVVKPGVYTQTYAVASKTHANATSAAVATTAATTTTPFGFTTGAQADAIPVAINAVRTDLDNLKQIVNAVIDDLQALGLVG